MVIPLFKHLLRLALTWRFAGNAEKTLNKRAAALVHGDFFLVLGWFWILFLEVLKSLPS